MAGVNPRIRPMPYLVLLGRLVVSAAFILAALPKIQDPQLLRSRWRAIV
jgi:hypothetical protein